MKSKRRHDLQTNQLADWIGKKIERVKPYSNMIVLGALVALVVVVGIVFFIGRNKSQSAKEWGLYTIEASMRNPDPAELTKVAQSDPDSPAHLWALQAAADAQSGKGIGLLYTEREDGLKELTKARKTYEVILQRAGDDPLLQRRARFGLAKTLESMGELESARKHYMELATAAQGFAIGKMAKRQVQRLSDPAVSDFYTKFATFDAQDSARDDFEPTFLPERPDIRFPGDYVPLSERPDISYPEPVEATGGGGQFDPQNPAGTDPLDPKDNGDGSGGSETTEKKETTNKSNDADNSDSSENPGAAATSDAANKADATEANKANAALPAANATPAGQPAAEEKSDE